MIRTCLRLEGWPEACVVMQVMMSVPQNDVLAHPNLRAFLSHVGINSMYEVYACPSDGAKIQERHNLLAHAMQRALHHPAVL